MTKEPRTGCLASKLRRQAPILASVQLPSAHPVSKPVNWRAAQDVSIAASVSGEKAHERFRGFRAPKPTRNVPQPR